MTGAEVEAQTGPTVQVKPGNSSGLCDYVLEGPGNQYFAAGTDVLVTVSAYVPCAVCTPLQSYEAQDPAALALTGIGDKALFSDKFGVVFFAHGQIVEISGSYVGKSGGGSNVLPGQKELEIALATDAVKVLGG